MIATFNTDDEHDLENDLDEAVISEDFSSSVRQKLKDQIYNPLDIASKSSLSQMFANTEIPNDRKIEITQELLLHLVMRYKIEIKDFEYTSNDIEQLITTTAEVYDKLILKYNKAFSNTVMLLLAKNEDIVGKAMQKAAVNIDKLTPTRFISKNLKKYGKDRNPRRVALLVAAVEYYFKDKESFENNFLDGLSKLITYPNVDYFSTETITTATKDFYISFLEQMYQLDDSDYLNIVIDQIQHDFLYKLIGVEND